MTTADHSDLSGSQGARIALVVDDHALFRAAIATILKQGCGFDFILEACSRDGAEHMLRTEKNISFASFDLNVPGMSGVGDLRSIREQFPSLLTAVISASDSRRDILPAIAAGMHGYILKSFGTEHMTAALNMILSGVVLVPWCVTKLNVLNEDHASFTADPPEVKLTKRQKEVLMLIRLGHSNKDIARILDLTESTIKVHTHAIYRNLGVHNRVAAISGLRRNAGLDSR